MPVTRKDRERAASLYLALQSAREPFLARARDNASYTIPAIMLPEGSDGHTDIADPYQSVGADGVNGLASKLLLTLLPPGLPWFALAVNQFEVEEAVTELGGIQDPNAVRFVTDINQSLVRIENEVHKFVDSSPHIRAGLFEAMEHLIVAGNAVLMLDDAGRTKVFHLDQYVCERSPDGQVRTLIVKEQLDRPSAPGWAEFAFTEKQELADLYTVVVRTGPDAYDVRQEINDQVVGPVRRSVPGDRLPYIALRFKRVSNQAYGRSKIEELIGDLRVLEGESESIAQGSAIAARTIGLVDPNGVARASELSKARNGDFVPGRDGEVTFLRVDKGQDFQVALQHQEGAVRRLNRAFLNKHSVQRDAERVTAREIQELIQDLEETLGGVFATLLGDVQLPVINRLLVILQDTARIPELPESKVHPIILAGVQGLGRGRDFNTLTAGAQVLQQTLGEQEFSRIHNSLEYAARVWNALGVETDKLMKTPEQLAQEVADARNAALIQQSAGPVAAAMASNATIQQP